MREKWKWLDYICTTRWFANFFLRCQPSLLWTFRLFDTNHRLQVINIEFPFTIRVTAPTKSLKRKVNHYRTGLQDHSSEVPRRLTEKLNTAFQEVNVKEVNERIVIGIEDVCLKTIPFKKNDPWRDATIKKLKWKLRNGYFREMANKINTAAEARRDKTIHCSNSFWKRLCVREPSLPPELETPEERRFKYQSKCPRWRKSYRSYQEL